MHITSPFCIHFCAFCTEDMNIYLQATELVSKTLSSCCFVRDVQTSKYQNSVWIAEPLCNIQRIHLCLLYKYNLWMWVPVTTAWRVLRLRMEEWPPIWRVAVNKLNKQPRTTDEGWSSSLGVGRGANNPSP